MASRFVDNGPPVVVTHEADARNPEFNITTAAFWKKKDHPRGDDGQFIENPNIIKPTPFTPLTKVPGFRKLTDADARTMQREMREKEYWSEDQAGSAEAYASYGYKNINAVLRGQDADLSENDRAWAMKFISELDSMMNPSTHDIVVSRGTRLNEFGVTTPEELAKLVGSRGTVKGFLSTSVYKPHNHSGSNGVRVTVEAPAGTRMVYLETATEDSEEYEMLLDHGLQYEIIDVKPSDGSEPSEVTLRVVL